MSTRRLLARLERLEKMAAKSRALRDPMDHQFRIDPAIAKAIRDDDWRLYELRQKKEMRQAEQEEYEIVKNRIKAMAGAIAVPAVYGPREKNRDSDRNGKFFSKRISPPPYNVLSPAEDAENARLTARLAAYAEMPVDANERLRRLESDSLYPFLRACLKDQVRLPPL